MPRSTTQEILLAVTLACAIIMVAALAYHAVAEAQTGMSPEAVKAKMENADLTPYTKPCAKGAGTVVESGDIHLLYYEKGPDWRQAVGLNRWFGNGRTIELGGGKFMVRLATGDVLCGISKDAITKSEILTGRMSKKK